jgi:hypothetical protein
MNFEQGACMNPGHVVLTMQCEPKQQFACRIKRVIPGEVHFLSTEPVAMHSPAEAEFDQGCRVVGKIVGCLKTGDNYLLSFHCDDSERRREQRFPVNQPGWLFTSLEPDATQIAVLLRDVSRNGVGLDVPDLLALRSSVILKTDECLVFGTVQYCEPFQFGFKAGIHIDETFFRNSDVPEDSEHNRVADFSARSKRIQ